MGQAMRTLRQTDTEKDVLYRDLDGRFMVRRFVRYGKKFHCKDEVPYQTWKTSKCSTVDERIAALEAAVVGLIQEREPRSFPASNLQTVSNLQDRAKQLWDQADELRKRADALLEERREVLDLLERIHRRGR